MHGFINDTHPISLSTIYFHFRHIENIQNICQNWYFDIFLCDCVRSDQSILKCASVCVAVCTENSELD